MERVQTMEGAMEAMEVQEQLNTAGQERAGGPLDFYVVQTGAAAARVANTVPFGSLH